MSAKKNVTEKSFVEKEKEDVKELLDILEKVPPDRKKEVLGIVKGFALCAEKAG